MKTVYCPVKKSQITGTDCLIVCDVTDRLLKPSALPQGIDWDEHLREVCAKCKYHSDLE